MTVNLFAKRSNYECAIDAECTSQECAGPLLIHIQPNWLAKEVMQYHLSENPKILN